MIFNMLNGYGVTGTNEIKFITVDNIEDVPEVAEEGTFAIKTNTPLNKIYVQNTEPSILSNGDIWIKTDLASLTPIKLGNITIYPTSVQQYIDNNWIILEGRIYLNGSWIELWGKILFLKGEEYTDFTGGWFAATSGVSVKDGLITVGGTSTTNHKNYYATHTKPISFAGNNTLKVHAVSFHNGTSAGRITAKIFDGVTNTQVASYSFLKYGDKGSDVYFEFDVSDLEDTYYIRINVYQAGKDGEHVKIIVDEVRLI